MAQAHIWLSSRPDAGPDRNQAPAVTTLGHARWTHPESIAWQDDSPFPANLHRDYATRRYVTSAGKRRGSRVGSTSATGHVCTRRRTAVPEIRNAFPRFFFLFSFPVDVFRPVAAARPGFSCCVRETRGMRPFWAKNVRNRLGGHSSARVLDLEDLLRRACFLTSDLGGMSI